MRALRSEGIRDSSHDSEFENDLPSILKEGLRLEADRATYDPAGFALTGADKEVNPTNVPPSNFPTKQLGVTESIGCCLSILTSAPSSAPPPIRY